MPSKNSGQFYLNWPNFTFDSTFSFSSILSVLRKIYSKQRMLVECAKLSIGSAQYSKSKTKSSRRFSFFQTRFTINTRERNKEGERVERLLHSWPFPSLVQAKLQTTSCHIFKRLRIESNWKKAKCNCILIGYRRELLCFVPSCFIRVEEIYGNKTGQENLKISNFQSRDLVQLCFRSPPRYRALKNALDMPTRRVKAGLENRSPSVLLSPPSPHLPLCNSRHA